MIELAGLTKTFGQTPNRTLVLAAKAVAAATFVKALAVADVRWLYPGYDMRWGPAGALAYFAAVYAAVFVVAVFVVNRRDA